MKMKTFPSSMHSRSAHKRTLCAPQCTHHTTQGMGRSYDTCDSCNDIGEDYDYCETCRSTYCHNCAKGKSLRGAVLWTGKCGSECSHGITSREKEYELAGQFPKHECIRCTDDPSRRWFDEGEMLDEAIKRLGYSGRSQLRKSMRDAMPRPEKRQKAGDGDDVPAIVVPAVVPSSGEGD